VLPGLEQLVVQCAPQVAPVTMLAIVKVESGGNPIAINVNGSRRLARQPKSKAEALAWSEWLISRGYSIDMGLTQVNSANLARLRTNIHAMFDPCANLAAGASILSREYANASRQLGSGQGALRAALSAYNTGNHRAGITNGYVARVSAAARPERSTPVAPTLRMAAISEGQASVSPRVFWAKR
jgi:type IV secretion system protein VirB1